MKPFDLEKALAGEPVCTRDGERVGNIRRMIMFEFDGMEFVADENGRFNTLSDNTRNGLGLDLFMVEQKLTPFSIERFLKGEKVVARGRIPIEWINIKFTDNGNIEGIEVFYGEKIGLSEYPIRRNYKVNGDGSVFASKEPTQYDLLHLTEE